MQNEKGSSIILGYTACAAFAINVTALAWIIVNKLKQRVSGSLVNFHIVSLMIHLIINFYFFENFPPYRKFIFDTMVSASTCLVKFNYSMTEDCGTITGKTSFDFLLTFLMMSIWIEIIYSIESVQLLKNPNSTFSLRGKITIVLLILVFFAHLIINILVGPKENISEYPGYFSYFSLVLSAFYLFYAIYAYFIISKTNKAKNNLSRHMKKMSFIFSLVVLFSSVFYFSLLVSSLVCIFVTNNLFAFQSEFMLYCLQGSAISIVRSITLVPRTAKSNQTSNEGNENSLQSNDDSGLSSGKGSVKLLAQKLDEASVQLESSSLLRSIQSNYQTECFYYMLRVILHISSNLNDKGNKVMPIAPKEYSKRINHEIILGEETVSQIISSDEEIPSFFQKITDNLALFSKKIRIIEYSPNVFHNIMLLDKLKCNVIEKSFNFESNIPNICSYSGSEGKSGSLFFMTHDNKFLLKTIPEREYNSMYNGFLEKYYNLITESNHSSLMRIYGTFQLNVGFNQMYFILMENIAPFPLNSFLFKFDLKGSTHGRQSKSIFRTNRTLKDLDYMDLIDMDKTSRIILDGFKIELLRSIIENDLRILYMSNLMDYSLFIGVLRNENLNIQMTPKMFYSKDKKYIYCIGIIDFLTEYKNLKSLEHTVLSIFNKKNTISAIHPLQYSIRFTKFVFNQVLLKED